MLVSQLKLTLSVTVGETFYINRYAYISCVNIKFYINKKEVVISLINLINLIITHEIQQIGVSFLLELIFRKFSNKNPHLCTKFNFNALTYNVIW